MDNCDGAAARKFSLAVTASAESAAGQSEAFRALTARPKGWVDAAMVRAELERQV